jgi:tetraacyldisaccharide 4'-kinase
MRKAPAFWWRAGRGAPALALWPLAKLWGLRSAARMNRAPRLRPPVPVICIGNFVLGGAGKTPTALAVARMARSRGLKPGFVASGYGGRAAGTLLVRPGDSATLVGDEPLLLAAVAPTVIGRDRAAAAARLLEEDVDLVVMDDGFQNPRLAKDLSLVVVDAAVGIGNGMVFPSGPLRAPLMPQLARADALVVIGEGEAAEPLIRAAARAGRQTQRARLKPLRAREWQRSGPILAFAGIARPEKFFATLAEVKAPVAETAGFPDHHYYTEAEAERLIAHADAAGLRLVTTEKDRARLAGSGGARGRLHERAEALEVVLEFENQAAIVEMIAETVHRVALRG